MAVRERAASRSVVLVRHAHPTVDSARPPGEWVLSEQGVAGAAELRARIPDLGTDRRVAASTEPKAIDTARLVLGVGDVTTRLGLCEVARPWYGDPTALNAHAVAYLCGETPDGWENADAAFARFDAAVRSLGDAPLVVSHGTVMAVWVSRIVPDLDVAAWWQALTMPDAWLVHLQAKTLTRL